MSGVFNLDKTRRAKTLCLGDTVGYVPDNFLALDNILKQQKSICID